MIKLFSPRRRGFNAGTGKNHHQQRHSIQVSLRYYHKSLATLWLSVFPVVSVKLAFRSHPTSKMPPISKKVHINVDLGEGYGNFKCGPDDELIPMIDHANVACGFHAGDPLIMQETVRTCKAHNIKVGAHPGLPDLQGFGRREMKMSTEELIAITRYQIGALKAFLDAEGVPLNHVKPHGVLYGMMYRDRDVCRAVYSAVPPGMPVFGLAGTIQEEVAKELGLPFVAELYGVSSPTRELMFDRGSLTVSSSCART
jgi:hypothetical protein